MKDLIQEGRKIQETFKSSINEDGRHNKFFSSVFDDLDSKFKTKKFATTSDYNEVSKYLQTKLPKWSQQKTMSIATSYGDYKKGTTEKEDAIIDLVKQFQRYQK